MVIRLHRFLPLVLLAIILQFLLSGCHSPAPSAAEPVEVGRSSAWSVTIQADSGDYSATNLATGWHLNGSLGERLSSPVARSGTDQLGSYDSISFNWDQDGPLSAEIRVYSRRPAILFREVCESARAKPPAAFPAFALPANLHRFGYKDSVFAPHSFKGGEASSPWLLFDDAGRAIIFSPGDNFMTSVVKLSEQDVLGSGFNAKLENLPAGQAHQTLLVEGESIHDTWNQWGHALTDATAKRRPANDSTVELSHLGYWTDNGSGYYYKYDLSRGYDGTLLDLAAAYRKLKIPLAYMQLDSWWYIKSTTAPDGKRGGKIKNSKMPAGTWNCYGGLTEYVAHPAVFPHGLASFDQGLGLALITHNRWIDVDSPYRKKYKISGIAAVDPKWWDDVTDYLKAAGVVVYEQDWLNEIYRNSPEFSSTTTAADAFMDNMARATQERGMRMQYCMELPQHYLQGAKYSNLTSVRVAGDRFERGKWTDALYTSQLAFSLGEWPWVDTFFSSEKENLILATLTAGPVGFGDEAEKINAQNISTSILPNGVIVKPDTSIVPLDRTYLSDATGHKAPMIAAAYTNHGPHRTAYVFCFPRSDRQTQIEFAPADLGFSSDVWVYEPASGKGQLVPASGKFSSTFSEANYKKAWAYYVVAPVSAGGIALVGDGGKITTAGRQRIANIQETPEGLAAAIQFASGEKSVTLIGYAAKQPVASVAGGADLPVKFDDTGHQFAVEVPASGSATAVDVSISVR